MVELEVVYAKPEQQVIIALTMPEEATVEAAIKASGLLQRFPEIAKSELKAGIFGVVCKLDQLVKEGDRIEIYRPLLHDPKEARRQRALK
jgi:putative ubiquitin-RnfH superfamily antitoxin RatB of RatAB toxin-antitoxin module